jgi:transposase
MEEVLDVYHKPYDARYPMVCFDERPVQLIGELHSPLPARPGIKARYDYEYRRNGVANVFMIFEPLKGKRRLDVTQRRTKQDWAKCLRWMVDELYGEAGKIVLVMDNLNTHKKASLYETFEPAEAKRIADKLEIHYTPKHGSWLNMAEIELSILSRQCLNERMENVENLRAECSAWLDKRNKQVTNVDWHFTTEDARIKLKRLYPSTHE